MQWAVLLSLFLAQLCMTPAGFIFLEFLDRSEQVETKELDDLGSHFHRLRFVRDPKTAASDIDVENASEPSTFGSLLPLDSPRQPSCQSVSVPPWRCEHRSTLTRRSRAPGARPLADSLA